MRKVVLIVALAMFLVVPDVFAIVLPKTHVVSVQWLSKNINNPHVVVVDVRYPKAYISGHIPNAVNIPFYRFFQITLSKGLKFFVASPRQIVPIFRNAGISNNSYVIFYTDNKKAKSFMFAARALWTAYYYGIKNVALLHGGIGAWIANGKSLSRVNVKKKGDFSIRHMNIGVIATWPDIDAAYSSHQFSLVDARNMVYFKGLDQDKRLTRHGHIPWAVDLFVGEFSKKLGNYYELISPEEAKSIFKNAGIDLKKPMITYCNIGLLASGDWFVAKFLAGIKKVKVYDGSMVEYSRLKDRPLEK